MNSKLAQDILFGCCIGLSGCAPSGFRGNRSRPVEIVRAGYKGLAGAAQSEKLPNRRSDPFLSLCCRSLAAARSPRL